MTVAMLKKNITVAKEKYEIAQFFFWTNIKFCNCYFNLHVIKLRSIAIKAFRGYSIEKKFQLWR